MTFWDMQTRVAEAVGIAAYGTSATDNTARPPTDPNRLDRVKREINAAIAEISRALDPRTNKLVKWSWMVAEHSVTLSVDGTGPYCVNGSPTLYSLPERVVSLPDRQVYFVRTSGGYGRGMPAGVVTPAIANRANIDIGTVRSCPRMVALQYDFANRDTNERGRPQLVVSPAPDAEYTVTMTVRMDPPRLVTDGDRGPWPSSLDYLICDWAAWLIGRFDTRGTKLDEKRLASLVSAIEDDASRTLSDLAPPTYPLPVRHSGDFALNINGTSVLS